MHHQDPDGQLNWLCSSKNSLITFVPWENFAFEINRSLDDLTILFDNVDIQESKKDIRILNLKIQSVGELARISHKPL